MEVRFGCSGRRIADPAVDHTDGHRLDGWQPFRDGGGRKAHRAREREGGDNVDAEDMETICAGDDTELALEPRDELGEEEALVAHGPVQDARAVCARFLARCTVVRAPAEVPVGEGGQSFPSATTRSAGCT